MMHEFHKRTLLQRFCEKKNFASLEFELMTFWLVSSCIAFLTGICISPIVIVLLWMSRCLANSEFWPYLMIGSKFSSYIMMASKLGTNEEPPHSSLKWKSCASRSLFRSSSNRLDHRKTCFNLARDYGEWITQSSLSPKTACKCESVSAREREKEKRRGRVGGGERGERGRERKCSRRKLRKATNTAFCGSRFSTECLENVLKEF